MTTLDVIRNNENRNPREEMQHNVLCNEALISPECFEMLFSRLNIRDANFCQVVKVLVWSCTQMGRNPPEIVEKFFLSDKFFSIFKESHKKCPKKWKKPKRGEGSPPKIKTPQFKVKTF